MLIPYTPIEKYYIFLIVLILYCLDIYLCLFLIILWAAKEMNNVFFIFFIHSLLLPRPATLLPTTYFSYCRHALSIYKISKSVITAADFVIPISQKWKRGSFFNKYEKRKRKRKILKQWLIIKEGKLADGRKGWMKKGTNYEKEIKEQ